MSLQAETRGTLEATGADPARAVRGLAATVVKRILAHLQSGRLIVDLPNGERIDYRAEQAGIEAHVAVHKWRALRRLISGGDLGFAKAYIDGDWSTPDLVAVMELAAGNGAQFIDRMSGNPLFRALNWVSHLRKANTRAGSRKNIEFHYDLGNEFYKLWLDRSMLYSSAIYTDEARTLEQAQQEKLRQILDMLEVGPDHDALEIGCGWGALAAAVASRTQARVTGITLSPSQLEFARQEIAARSLSHRVELKLEDYRDTKGRFDRIVSIEMIEAVGHKYWPGYFGALRDRLKPGGIAVIQAITIAEDRFEAYRARPDFIQRYIFPGGFLPTKTAIGSALAQADLRLITTRNFGESYALTLADWRRRFEDNWPRIEKLGFDASFKRLWEYYLCYCEAGFRTGVIDVGLYSIGHAAAR
jgi:cyclopropane-fatty-acyl-phospholipid synthase